MIATWTTLRLLQMCGVYIRPKIILSLIAFVWLSFGIFYHKRKELHRMYSKMFFFHWEKRHKRQG